MPNAHGAGPQIGADLIVMLLLRSQKTGLLFEGYKVTGVPFERVFEGATKEG
jgi:hypothetical protein